jgi:tetratricopeptide (TPR) repeat protein
MGEAKRRKGSGAALAAPDLGALLERGKQYQRGGEPLAALSLYSQVLARSPAHFDALRLSALALVELGQLALATQRLKEALALQPGDASLNYQLGRVHLLAGATLEALASFDAALRCDPTHSPTLYMRAATLEGLGDVAGAAERFAAAAAADPTRVLAHVGAARQLYLLDRLPEAVAHQRSAAGVDARTLADGVIGYCRARRAAETPQARIRRSAALCRGPQGADLEEAAHERELIVADDFLAQPLERREYALAQNFTDASQHVGGNFPGTQTAGGHADPETMQRIADMLGRDIKWSWPSHGAFRLSPADAKARSDIHSDQDQTRPAYAGVLYLSRPEDCHGGTGFWRHRETGWTKVPSAVEASASRYGSYAEFMRLRWAETDRDFGQLTAGRDEWEPVLEVPMRFNRLILYRSDYFHAISRLFGESPADARLVQLFFFEPLQAPR